MKNKNGITLIALVITIVVLLILAGVAINLTLGDNGIFKKATTAREDYGIAAAKEKIELKIAEMQAEKEGKATLEELVEYLKNDPDIDYTVSLTEITASLTADVTIGDAKEIYVVYNKYQFKVNKNLKTEYVSKVGASEEKPQAYSYKNPYIPTGFIHTEGTWNSGYTIKGVEQSTDNEFVWVPCVLEQTDESTEDGVVTFGRITTGKYILSGMKVTGEEKSATEIKTSVGTYGGFYIAKYEAGVPGTIASTTTNDANKQNLTQKPVSKSNVGVWNHITRANAITVSKAMIDKAATGVSSTLISGEAWDTTLAWITKTNSSYAENSTGKGNYTGGILTTGKNTVYAVNNIYDMAGNVNEWTTENCIYNSNSYFTIRGGSYDGSGSSYPAARRNIGGSGAGGNIGFRTLLYK